MIEKVPEMKIVQIPTEKLRLNNKNRTNGGLPLIKSVEDVGILLPVYVVPEDRGYYKVIAGNRRVYSAQVYKLKTVPCIIVEVEDASNTSAQQIGIEALENLDRLPLNPMDLSSVALKLEAAYMDPRRAANILNVSLLKFKKLINLDRLIPEYKNKVKEGKLNLDTAAEIALLKKEEQEELFSNPYNYQNPAAVKSWYQRKNTNLAQVINEVREYVYDGRTCNNCQFRSDRDNGLFEPAPGDIFCYHADCLKAKVKAYSDETKTLCSIGYYPKGYKPVNSDMSFYRHRELFEDGITSTGSKCQYIDTGKIPAEKPKKEDPHAQERVEVFKEYEAKAEEVMTRACKALYLHWRENSSGEVDRRIMWLLNFSDVLDSYYEDEIEDLIPAEDANSEDDWVCINRAMIDYVFEPEWSGHEARHPNELRVFEWEFPGVADFYQEYLGVFKSFAAKMLSLGDKKPMDKVKSFKVRTFEGKSNG